MSEDRVDRNRIGRKGRTARTRRSLRRLAAVLVLVGLVGVAFLLGGFVRYTDEVGILSHRGSPPRADAIVVLTGGAHRIQRALELLRDGHGERLLISGVNPGTSAGALADLTDAERSLFDCCVDLDYAALDTVGNAESARDWAERNGFDEIILVTSDYHMPRSLREFERAGSLRSVSPVAVSRDDLWRADGLPSERGLRVLAVEYMKLVATRMAGLVSKRFGAATEHRAAMVDLTDGTP